MASFFYSLKKAAKVFFHNLTMEESHLTGQQTEDHVRKYIFLNQYYDLLEKTHDNFQNKSDYVESSLNPDFKFRERSTAFEFYVEVKYRSWLTDDKVVWANDEQLHRYRTIDRSVPVYICIFLDLDDLKIVSLFPLSKFPYVGIFPSVLKNYSIERYKPYRF